MAAATLPLTPGGVGVQEVAMAGLFHEVAGVPDGYSGLIVAAMYRVILIAVAAFGAVVYFSGRAPTRPSNQPAIHHPPGSTEH
jgi:uncharacterized membrane protein YbhN (UPF0104 family)